MNKETNNSITIVIWSLVGLLAGALFGGLMGLEGRGLVFPAVVGLVLSGMASYRYMFNFSPKDEKDKHESAENTAQRDVVKKERITPEAAMSIKKTSKMGRIDGVIVSPLKTFPDDRGYFREMFRLAESPLIRASQVSATMSYPGVIKAFHYHNNQDDLWYCAKGMIQAVMYDRRSDSPTYKMTQVVPMGDLSPQTLFIPRGVVHGYKVLGPDSVLVIYATTQVYDPNDELRIPHDDPEIGFDWEVKPR